jgi:hypothetical protein
VIGDIVELHSLTSLWYPDDGFTLADDGTHVYDTLRCRRSNQRERVCTVVAIIVTSFVVGNTNFMCHYDFTRNHDTLVVVDEDGLVWCTRCNP